MDIPKQQEHALKSLFCIYFRKIKTVSSVYSDPVYLSAMPHHGLETMLCVQVPPLYKTVLGAEETYVKLNVYNNCKHYKVFWFPSLKSFQFNSINTEQQ